MTATHGSKKSPVYDIAKRADEWSMQSAVARQLKLGGDARESYWQPRQSISAAIRRAVGITR